MARTRETARKSVGAGLPPRVLFPKEAPAREIVIISDDEEEPMMMEEEPIEEDTVLLVNITGHEEDDEEPAPAAPTPPLSASPAPSPAASASASPTPAPAAFAEEGEQEMAPADEEEPKEEPRWTRTYIYKHAPHTAYHHKLLNDILLDYYADLNTGIQYYCVEYTHPTEVTYWKTELTVTVWKDDKNGRVVNTIHGHMSKHAEAFGSMEDAAREAYEYYHGLRYEAMETDRFRYLSRYDAQKKDWVVQTLSIALLPWTLQCGMLLH
jgi:hypothetical protein